MQNIKNTIVGVVLIAIVAFVGYKYFDGKKSVIQTTEVKNESQVQNDTTTLPNVSSSPTEKPAAQVVSSYTLSEISKHNTSSNCWTVVSGKVYNVTEFIPSHPGGRDIVKACGKDGTSLFMKEDEHIEQNAMATLDAFFIGTLKN